MKLFNVLLAVVMACAGIQFVCAQNVVIYQGNSISEYTKPDSIMFVDNIYDRDQVTAWTRAHLDSLVDVAWQKLLSSDMPNHRDPDETREVFRKIGYNGRNVFTYTGGGAVVDSVIMERLIDRALADKKHNAVLLVGNSGAGKSYSLRQNHELQKLSTEAGVVLDEVFTDRNAVVATINRLKERGLTDVTLVMIYREAFESFKSAADRFVSTGRVIGLNFFAGPFLYKSYEGYVDWLEHDNVGDARYYIDNTVAGGSKLVTADQAKKWDYNISDEQYKDLLKFAFDFTLEKNLSYRDAYALFFDR